MAKPFILRRISDRMKRRGLGFHPQAAHNQNRTVRGSEEMADASQYSDSTSPINPEQSEITRPSGVLTDAELRMIRSSPWVSQCADLRIIGNDVCRQFGLSVDDIVSRKLDRITVEARHMFCLIAHRRGFAYTVIGDFLGGRDHTTVMNSIQRARETVGRV